METCSICGKEISTNADESFQYYDKSCGEHICLECIQKYDTCSRCEELIIDSSDVESYKNKGSFLCERCYEEIYKEEHE
ncbi:hypothetical protein ACWCL1_08880 [Ligilactobacillus sp. LYQ135]